MALGGATDGRVAGQIAHRIQIDGKEDGAAAQSCGSQRGFNTGVACANDGYITFSCVVSHIRSSLEREIVVYTTSGTAAKGFPLGGKGL
jgi:hypothetical protein